MRLKLSLLDVCVIMIIIGVWAALLLPANDFDRRHRYPPQASLPGDNLADIAGEYYKGASRGMSLSLSILPDGRYSFIWSGCTGVHHRESGYIQSTDGSYVLSPLQRVEAGIDHHFLLVRWQSRRYLVPPEKMDEFCDAVIKGEEPRIEYAGDFYLSVPFDQADGLPELPDRWASQLRAGVTVGKIMEVTKPGLVRVDFGTACGIEAGSILTLRGSRRFDFRRLSVISAENGSCTAHECDHETHEEPLLPGREVIAERPGEVEDDP